MYYSIKFGLFMIFKYCNTRYTSMWTTAIIFESLFNTLFGTDWWKREQPS
jgi:hypothetical protein